MLDLPRYIGQALVYGIVAAAIGVASSHPLYRQFPDGQAQIKMSFTHGTPRETACRRLSPQEIAKLPANQRRPNDCGRGRVPALVQLDVDGRVVYEAVLKPAGVAGDGPVRVYEKLAVPAGRHVVVARLRDSGRAEGFDYERARTVDLAPGDSLAVDFRTDTGGFTFR